MKPHGTRSRYNSGCRCEACKAAENTADVRIPGKGWVEIRLPEMDKEAWPCR